MTPLELALALALVAVGLVGSALWSGFETGIYSLNRVRLTIAARRGHPRAAARLLREIDHPDRVLATLLIGTNLFNYLGVLALTTILERFGFSSPALMLIQVLVLSPVILVLGESVPKEVFRRYADRLCVPLTPLLTAARWFYTALGVLPIVLLFARSLARLSGADAGAALQREPRQRLAALLKEGAALGALSSGQSTLIDHAIRFHNATVGQVTVPWVRVRRLNAEWDRPRVLEAIARHPRSHYPVIDRRGQVLGVLDTLSLHVHPEAAWTTLIEPPARLGSEMPLRQAVVALRDAGTALGIVKRGGRIVGIVSERDLVGPLFGLEARP